MEIDTTIRESSLLVFLKPTGLPQGEVYIRSTQYVRVDGMITKQDEEKKDQDQEKKSKKKQKKKKK